MTTVTVLAENAVARLGLLGEHGLAWWIDTGAQRVLFDVQVQIRRGDCC